ncbi:uncharacterized protein EV420DRAFT_1727094 [Desarmillaria tabescens]|uniref:Uncharacterized protein n=1 Tax=Armillaria tabescens TaxID=1929756 RepID=A0AA39JID1_ARMTA|nr:uncharacterized protein EV420DRAFT_1727094 [Desarmillaria tabescens]KAK0442722.1 hypothetical protein EV420DRAFT_1727094 [Desarmillaria tabescens]
MLPHGFFLHLHRKCTNINKVTLDNVTFASSSVFTSFIGASPKLKALRLKLVSTAVDSESWEDLQGYAMTPQAAINTLDVNLSEESMLRVCHDIFEEDDAPVSIAQLQILRISDIKQLSHWDCVTDMVQMSAKTAESANRLHPDWYVDIQYSDLAHADVEALPIMPLPSLKHLHIHLDDFEEYVDILGWWIQCFEDTAANSVRLGKITITIKAYSLDRDRVAESQLPDLIAMQEEQRILGQWFQYEVPSDEICLPKDDVWCNLGACLPLLTDELVIKFARARPNDPFKNRIDQLKEIIRGRMCRFKDAGGVLVFEVEPV